MYLQLTTRCNMKCKHCCMNAKKTGEDISIETLRKVLYYFSGDYITLGGGEPTLHPLFWQILAETLASAEGIWLATNGSNTAISLALAKLADKGIIGCALSLDDYHSKIDDIVIKAFQHKSILNENVDKRIRNVMGNILNIGRAKTNQIYDVKKGCCCSDIFVKPNGDVHGCGCPDSPCFGNINDKNFQINSEWQNGECWKEQSTQEDKPLLYSPSDETEEIKI